MELPKKVYVQICRDEEGEFPVSFLNEEEAAGAEYGIYVLLEPITITGENG